MRQQSERPRMMNNYAIMRHYYIIINDTRA